MVLSVGLLRLLSTAWVAAVVLKLLGCVTPGKPLPVVVVAPEVVVVGADVGDVRASVTVVFTGTGIAFGAKQRKRSRIFATLL